VSREKAPQLSNRDGFEKKSGERKGKMSVIWKKVELLENERMGEVRHWDHRPTLQGGKTGPEGEKFHSVRQ